MHGTSHSFSVRGKNDAEILFSDDFGEDHPADREAAAETEISSAVLRGETDRDG